MNRVNIFAKKIFSLFLVVCLTVPTINLYKINAADINNISEPVYRVEKNLEGTDAFVYAYNVLEYGADNTGNNDNTQIFQKLMNKVYQLGGGIVYVPSGRYKITGSLKIPKGVTLRGDWTKPTAGNNLTSGTVLMAYVGRNQDETSQPFIEMEPETGCKELTIWYPEQTPNNIVPYSPTIRLGVNQYTGNYFGNEYTNVKNVTLVNSYIGIWWNKYNGGASPVLNGIYGTPLKKGIEIDCIADIGRIEWVNFSPDFWSGSGFENSPEKGSEFENYIYENGTGIVMKRNDWSYTCFVTIKGYNIGYNTQYSSEGNGATPNGHHYKFDLRKCKNGIVFDATNSVGILFDDITIYNCENGIVVSEGTGDVIQFTKTKITASKYAININKTSTNKFLMYDANIVKGLVNVDGGTLMCSGSRFESKAPEIVIGSLGRVSLAGNTFTNGKQIINNSIYVSQLDNAEIEYVEVPSFPDDNAKFDSNMPDKLTIYDVTKSPYYADNSRNHGGGNDCTNAIQNALNDASANGGGIVFLPSGHYRMNGTIVIPSNVELRGATDLSTVPHGTGAILESYANKNNPSGTPFIRLASNGGIRGVIINYPEQIYNLDGNGEYHPYDYPYTMQGMGSDIYVINVGVRAATGALDLATYKCDNHYVDFLAGHVNKVCVKVGNGTENGILNNLMFNTIVYACGQESKFGSFPNGPTGSNSPVYDQQLRDLDFLILGDCLNESLYNCFPYGAYIGLKLVNEGKGGPQNLISMGLGIDGSRKSMYFTSGLTGNMNFINSQIVSLNNDQPITRYFETESNSNFKANLFNTDLWGFPEKSVVMGENGGELNLYTANFQMRGYNGALNVSNGGNLNIVSSNFNNHNSTFATGANNISVINSIADYTNTSASNFKQNISNFSNTLEISASQNANMLNRNGWQASAYPHNENAWLSLDGNLNTQWTTSGVQTAGQWYQVDMQKNQSFDLVVTTLGATGDVPRAYKVLLSNDGTNWWQVASGENSNVFSVGEQNARFIRIEQTGSEAHWWAVYEFYVLKSSTYDVGDGEYIEDEEMVEEPTINPGLTNLSSGKIAVSSADENDTYPASNAIDGDVSTRWSSTYNDDAWIYVDLRNVYSVEQILLNWEAAYGKDYNIEVSIDGRKWDKIATLSNQDGEKDIISFAPVNARYVKLQGVTRALEYGYSLWEFEVYGVNEIVHGSIEISDELKIEGYQISYVLEGLRVVSSVEPVINGKTVIKSGNVYGIASMGINENDLVIDSDNEYVAHFEATDEGIIGRQMGESETANYYAMTMIGNGYTSDDYNREYIVRAYAVLDDGSVVYSNSSTYSIYKVASKLYNGILMSNYAGHSYLYNKILCVVDPNYARVDYNWNNILYK